MPQVSEFEAEKLVKSYSLRFGQCNNFLDVAKFYRRNTDAPVKLLNEASAEMGKLIVEMKATMEKLPAEMKNVRSRLSALIGDAEKSIKAMDTLKSQLKGKGRKSELEVFQARYESIMSEYNTMGAKTRAKLDAHLVKAEKLRDELKKKADRLESIRPTLDVEFNRKVLDAKTETYVLLGKVQKHVEQVKSELPSKAVPKRVVEI